jgi:enolase-phosphatase E1
VKTLLFDIEGTTTDIAFVHKVLFPYSMDRIEAYVRENSNHPVINQVREVLLHERNIQASLTDVIDALKLWIRTDRKQSALKSLQGDIWQKGYESGAFQGHVYSDVLPAWLNWKKQGHQLAIYSSGSVPAQKLLFRFSTVGDLTVHLSHYFDTKVGGKREAKSYQNIKEALKTEIIFFSDIKEELDAARMAGLETVQVFREGILLTPHLAITSFADYKL